MGTIRKRGKVWYVDYYYKGKRYIKAISKHKRLAELALKDIEVKIEKEEHLGVHVVGKVTLFTFAKKYLEYSKVNKVLKSYERDGLSLKHLTKVFGSAYLQEITPEKIENYKNNRLMDVRPATVNRELTCFKHLFTKAIEWDYINENPVRKVKLLKEPPGRVRYLGRGEVDKLLEYSPNHLKPIVITALNTGMRKGEILNLKWNNLDFERKIITILRSKSNEIRMIPMNNLVYNVLQNLPHNGEYIFLWNGNKIGDIKKAFGNTVKKAGIDDFTFHDLRHTFASCLAMKGYNLKTIQTLMGHKTIAMTLRYAHLSRAHLKEAVESLEENLGGNKLVAMKRNQK